MRQACVDLAGAVTGQSASPYPPGTHWSLALSELRSQMTKATFEA